jgi:hypothetical protein
MKIFSWKIEISELHSMQQPFIWMAKQLYFFLFKPTGYKEHINHSLIFGNKCLIYKMDDATLWHISYERLSHLEIPENSYYGASMQHPCVIFVHTNDNDKYSFPHNLTETMITEISVEIAKSVHSSSSMERKISIIMGLWSEGFLSDSEVKSWADKQILNSDEDLYDPLIELSLKGPEVCVKKPSYEFPSRMKFTFREKFAIRLAKLNLESAEEKKQFINWTARHAMGEDQNIPEVQFGYQLDHYLDYDQMDPLVYFERNVELYREASEKILNLLLKQSNF